MASASVLIVDDDAPSAKLFTVVLQSEGFATRAVGSAEEAAAAIALARPRAVVLDIVLPAMSGIAFAELLHADPQTNDIPIIAVSAYEFERAALDAGCAAFVRKPIDPIDFPALVAKHLGGD